MIESVATHLRSIWLGCLAIGILRGSFGVELAALAPFLAVHFRYLGFQIL